jgi:hypothetical protein
MSPDDAADAVLAAADAFTAKIGACARSVTIEQSTEWEYFVQAKEEPVRFLVLQPFLFSAFSPPALLPQPSHW